MQWQENHTVLKFFRNFAVRCFVQMVCENFATAHSLIPLYATQDRLCWSGTKEEYNNENKKCYAKK